jgi:hypothetical protein
MYNKSNCFKKGGKAKLFSPREVSSWAEDTLKTFSNLEPNRSGQRWRDGVANLSMFGLKSNEKIFRMARSKNGELSVL